MRLEGSTHLTPPFAWYLKNSGLATSDLAGGLLRVALLKSLAAWLR
jgi:hypothetical protein